MKQLSLLTITALLAAVISQAQTKIYVNSTATGSNNGSNWTDAYTDFQTGVNAASAGDSVFVAGGTYQPASGASFSMKEGVKIYGGFAGTEASIAQRVIWAGHSSILQGNGSTVINNSSNNLTSLAVLDGFLITGGNFSSSGGGMYNNASSPTLRSLTFYNNTAIGGGGGMYNNGSSPTLTNITFAGNSTTFRGGAIYNLFSNPTLTNVTFVNNTAGAGQGGAVFNYASNPVTINAIFWGNTAHSEPDIYNHDGSPSVTYTYSETALDGAGTGNITNASDPFVNDANPAGNDGIWATPDDGLYLQSGSLAVDAGDNNSINATGVTIDIAGGARIQNGVVNMGAYEEPSSLLPLTLLSFSVQEQDQHVQLQWLTANEINTSYFNIERSRDGEIFNTIGTTAAKGSGGNHYTAADFLSYKMFTGGKIYYRLKMVDQDGKFSYSRIVPISLTNDNNSLLPYPNPAKNEFYINASKPCLISIYNESGHLVKIQSLLPGTNVIDISALAAGTYFCLVKEKKLKIVKQ